VGGDKRLCAQLLGIATRTIYRRLEEERGGDGPVEASAAQDHPDGDKDDEDDAPVPEANGASVPNWHPAASTGRT
jgi:hypothetical protein